MSKCWEERKRKAIELQKLWDEIEASKLSAAEYEALVVAGLPLFEKCDELFKEFDAKETEFFKTYGTGWNFVVKEEDEEHELFIDTAANNTEEKEKAAVELSRLWDEMEECRKVCADKFAELDKIRQEYRDVFLDCTPEDVRVEYFSRTKAARAAEKKRYELFGMFKSKCREFFKTYGDSWVSVVQEGNKE